MTDETEINAKAIGAALRHFRVLRAFNSSRLAKLSGVSAPYMHQIEQGERIPSVAVLYRVLVALRTSPARFFQRVEFEEKQQVKFETKRGQLRRQEGA